MTKIRAILLDFYGTVVHEDDVVIADVTGQIAESIGRPEAGAEIGKYWWRLFSSLCEESFGAAFRPQRVLEHESLQRTLDRFDSPLDPDQFSSLLYEYWQRPALFDDAAQFLNHNDLPICVVSNIDRVDITCAIEHHGLHLERIITSEDARAYKPRGELFHLALAELDADPAEVIHVGDSLSSDIAGARAAGIRSAWVNRKAKPASALPTWTVTSLLELPVNP